MKTEITTITFTNPHLEMWTERIRQYSLNDEQNKRNTAYALGQVMTTKCYTDDGFKSVSDYAEQTFGIKKAQASKFARIGLKFLVEDVDGNAQYNVNILGDGNWTLGNLSELTGDKTSVEDIKRAVESGAISDESTQQDLREWASESDSTTTVEARYTADSDIFSDGVPRDIGAYETAIHEFSDLPHDIKRIKVGTDVILLVYWYTAKEKTGKPVCLNPDMIPQTVTLHKYIEPKTKKSRANAKEPERKFTREQLLAMLAAMDEVTE